MRKPSPRLIAEIGLVVAIVAITAVDLRDDHAGKPHVASPAGATNTLRAELLRCQRLGKAALDDEACTAVWAENRKRFFGAAIGTSVRQGRAGDEAARAP